MRTGRALTVSEGRGGVGASQKEFFGGKEIEKKKKKKFWRPPKFGEPPPPRKFGEPPQIWRNPPRDQTHPPPENSENPHQIWRNPPRDQTHPPTPRTRPTPTCGQNSWHTLLKILPWPNFVAAGKNFGAHLRSHWEILGSAITLDSMSHPLMRTKVLQREYEMYCTAFSQICLPARGGLPGRGGSPWQGGIPACTEADPPPLWTEWQTGIKILPWPKLRFGR